MPALFTETLPPEFVQDEQGTAKLEDYALLELAERYGTPLWVVSAQRLRGNYEEIVAAFHSYPGEVEIAYSIKANNVAAIIEVLHEQGALVDTSGEFEHYVAEKAGVAPGEMIVNGNGKSREAIDWLVRSRVRQVNIDSLDEVSRLELAAGEAGTMVDCLLRLHPTHRTLLSRDPRFATMVEVGEGKFGLYIETGQALAAMEMVLGSAHLRFKGLHCHVGFSGYTDTYSAQSELLHYRDAVAEVCAFAEEVRRRFGVVAERLDLGGGFRRGPAILRATPRSGSDLAVARTPGVAEYAEVIMDTIQTAPRFGATTWIPSLQFELGGFLVADAVTLLTTVTDVKVVDREAPKRYVSVDASSMMQTSRLRQHVVSPVVKVGGKAARLDWEHPATVVGQTCVYDALIENVVLPPLEEGDVLALFHQGAYYEVSSTQFNGFPRPAVVMLDGREVRVVRARETVEAMFARDTLREAN